MISDPQEKNIVSMLSLIIQKPIEEISLFSTIIGVFLSFKALSFMAL
jgi:hypothetical protein